MTSERIEQLLEEGNALAREALAQQRDAISMQRAALASQQAVLDEARETERLVRANIERAAQVNEGAAALARGARRFALLLLPVVVLLIGYLTWLLFSRL